MADERGSRSRRANLRRALSGHLMRVVVVLVLVAGLFGLVVFWQQHDAEPGLVAAPAPTAVEATVMTVTPETVPVEPTYLGQTEASQTVEIRARVAGYLESQAFEEGSLVEAGQLLFQIDPRDFETELAIAQATVASAEARAERARRQVERFRELEAQRVATTSEVDEWETELLVTTAEVRLAEARVAQAELNLGYARIESPITGVIGEAERDVGSYVGPQDGGLLAVVEQQDPMQVRFSVSEADILRWQSQTASGVIESPGVEGMRVELTLADGTVHPHLGRVEFMGVRVDPTTGSTMVQAVVPNPDGNLRSGQFAHARVIGARRRNALLVPQAALVQNPTGSYVYAVNDEGLAELRAVAIGDWVDGRVVIESGLEAGDRVVLDRLLMMRPGVEVRALAPEKDGAGPGGDEPGGTDPVRPDGGGAGVGAGVGGVDGGEG